METQLYNPREGGGKGPLMPRVTFKDVIKLADDLDMESELLEECVQNFV